MSTPKALIALLAAVALLAAGIFLGGHPTALPGSVRDLLVDDNVSLQAEAANVIEDNFYRKVPASELRNASLKGMVRSLHNRFSSYFTPAENKIFERSTNGEFSGVGMTVVESRRGLRVTGVFEGSPAKRAGIGPGEVIVAVDGHSIAGEGSTVATARIKGPAGTHVRLTIVRPGGKRRELRVKRANIKVPVVMSRLRMVGGKKVGVLALTSFTSGAHGELRAAVQRLLKRGPQGFVLDLRENGGGLLSEAVLVASVFVPSGVVVTTEGRTKHKSVLVATGDALTRKPVAVLVDRGTASAAEIVTAALRERVGAKVIGTRTFGKGVFGQIFELSNGGALDLIVGNYFTPNGENINNRGIKPDVLAVDVRKTRTDEALDRALQVLGEQIDRTRTLHGENRKRS